MTVRKCTALLLAVLLLCGVLCTGAGAATAENVRHYDTYLCLGDSIAAGYGPYNRAVKGFERVDTAYHAMVADAVTANTLYPFGCTGMRTSEVRYLLDKSYPGDDYLFQLYDIPGDRRAELRSQFDKAVRTADLITLNVGSNDVLTYSFSRAMEVLNAEDGQLAAQIKELLADGGGVGDAMEKLFSAAQTAGRLPGVLAAFVQGMYQGYQGFQKNWDPIVKYIYDVNPDVTLVVVGIVNPMKNVKLTDLSLLRIGSAFNVITRMMNQHMQRRSAYADRYLFADVWETETFELTLTSGTNPKDMINLMHPTLDGHKYMAQQILSVLPERGSDPGPKPEPKPDPKPGDDVQDFPFADVTPGDWFYDDVYYVWDSGILQGTGSDTFSPDGVTTRAQFAAVLYRMAGNPSVTGRDRAKCRFTDLKEDWYRDAVVWASSKGIVQGVSARAFDPDSEITREQLVTMLWRYSREQAKNTDLSAFSDSADIQGFARPAVAWATENGIVNGLPDGTFQPQGFASRAQLAAILSRYLMR